MSVKYIELLIKVHGLNASKEGVDNLLVNVKKELEGKLLQDYRLKFRNEFDSDIEVELVSFAGEIESE